MFAINKKPGSSKPLTTVVNNLSPQPSLRPQPSPHPRTASSTPSLLFHSSVDAPSWTALGAIRLIPFSRLKTLVWLTTCKTFIYIFRTQLFGIAALQVAEVYRLKKPASGQHESLCAEVKHEGETHFILFDRMSSAHLRNSW